MGWGERIIWIILVILALFFGALLAALCAVAGRADDKMEGCDDGGNEKG